VKHKAVVCHNVGHHGILQWLFHYNAFLGVYVISRKAILMLAQTSRILLIIVAFFTFAETVSAQVLVNGNFEGGTFIDPTTGDILPNGWALGPPSPSTLSKVNIDSATNPPTFLGPENGTFYARFQSPANNGTRDCLLQDLHTITGQRYTVSFWVAITSTSVGNVSGLDPEWDENTPNQSTMGASQFYFAPTNTSPVNYQHFTFVETASTNLTRIDFHGIDANGSILLDNISVTAVPEPSTMVFMGLSVAVAYSIWHLNRRRKVQLSERLVEADGLAV